MSDIGNKQVFAKNLANQMNRRNLDRNKLCADLGFKYTTVSEWLAARKYPRIDKIELLANYFGIQKSDLIEDKSDRAKVILKRASALCQEKGITLEQMAADLHIDLNVLCELNKTELEAKVNPIAPDAIRAVFEMAKYLGVWTPYLNGDSDDLSLARAMTGKEILLEHTELVEVNPKDDRLRKIVVKIDALPDSDRSNLLDQIDNMLNFYYQTLLNNQKKEE